MSRRVGRCLRSVGTVLLGIALSVGAPFAAQDQKTVVLSTPGSESLDTTIRGGSHAYVNFDKDDLATRASDSAEYERRALLRFDTQSQVPAKATIQSATLTLTVKGGNTATRRVSVYRVMEPFDADVATWAQRRRGYGWQSDGAASGDKQAEATVQGTVGSTVTFDVTALVQAVVNDSGSRWTRVALIDLGKATAASYREYHASETSSQSLRPSLAVTYTSSSSALSPAPLGGGAAAPKPIALPSGWSTRDIGSVGEDGTTRYANGTFSIAGAGADIWKSADHFRFAYRTLKGDGAIEAKVHALEDVHDWSKAGVMMRETLFGNSRYTYMLVSPDEGLAFQRRTAAGAASVHTAGGAESAPYFVKLARAGSRFSAYSSKDGSTWKLVGRSTITMAETIYVGLAVTSHVKGTLATGTFDDVAVKIAPTPSRDVPKPPPPDDPKPSPPKPPARPREPNTSKTLRLLHWNVRHGGTRTDGVYDPAGLVGWMLKWNPDVVSMNEMDSASQAERIVDQLTAQSGVTWKYHAGRGNVVATRLQVTAQSLCTVNSGVGRNATHLSIIVNGRTVNVWSAHLGLESSSSRAREVRELQECSTQWAEARILAGDYNMQAGSTEYHAALKGHVDAWKAAKALGTAKNYSGNCDGCTRNSRIDYVFTSKGATWLNLRSAQIMDTRNAKRVMASDHKPMLVIYDVK